MVQLSALGQISVTAPFYLENKRKIHPRGVRACRPKRREEESAREHTRAVERDPQPFGSSFYDFFFLTLGLPYVNWASQECCLFYPKSSFRSSDLPLFYFHRLFPCLLTTTILDSFFLFYLPNIPPSRDGRPNSLGIGASRSFWLLPAELEW